MKFKWINKKIKESDLTLTLPVKKSKGEYEKFLELMKSKKELHKTIIKNQNKYL